MDVRKKTESDPHDTAGQDFVRRIGPAGCALFLILFVLTTVMCFASGRAPIPGYEAPETTEYYAEHPDALVRELEENVFPALPDYDMTAAVTGDTVTVTIDEASYSDARAAILRYFDQSLLVFRQG